MENLSHIELQGHPLASLKPLMKQEFLTWERLISELTLEEIEQLIRCFTLLEQQPGWEAGKHSPVIGLFKVHRARKGSIDTELVHWVKSHTDNRFLPFGSLL